MNLKIRNERNHNEYVMIEPWAIDIELKPNDTLLLIINGIQSSDVLEYQYLSGNRVSLFSPNIESVQVFINGQDVSGIYCFE